MPAGEPPDRRGDRGGQRADGEVAKAIGDLHDHLRHVESLVGDGVHDLGNERRAGWQRPDAGEQRWPVALAVAVAVIAQVALPDRLTIGPRWLLPVLESALLVGLVAANPRRVDRASRALRAASIGLIAVTSLANGWSSVELVREILDGTAGRSAGPLFATGGAIYFTNVIVFSLWYWETDRGGPVARARATRPYPDFLFPQMTQEGLAPAAWRPTYVDYLYTSFTNATAFSPTDVMPLSHLAKLLMGSQSIVALVTVALVVARAVNILS